MPYADYEPIRELLGGRNKVVLASRKKAGSRRPSEQFALKFINLKDYTPGQILIALDELNLLRRFQHSHIIRLRECEMITTGSVKALMLVTDYAQGGSLGDRVRDMGGQQIHGTWVNQSVIWFAQIASALNHCHEQNVIHRDIKLDNIFVSAIGDALLADFGMARELSSSGHASTLLGTPMNMSPELWVSGSKYGRGTDLWALGCVVWELVTLHHPFAAAKDPRALRDLVQAPCSTLAERLRASGFKPSVSVAPDACELANELLAVATTLLLQDFDIRPSCAQLLASPLLAGAALLA
ncbi:kinase-like domain-containing protein [Pavlovales sp. CCMP2436]|nr:kinase-like domain-containing protein [Pavlovales sp. CCMP2436]